MKTEHWIALGAGAFFLCVGLWTSFHQESSFNQALKAIKMLDTSQSIVISIKARNESGYHINGEALDFFSSVDDFEAYSLGKRAEAAYVEDVGQFRIDPNDFLVKLLVNPHSDEYVYGYIGRESSGVYYNYGSFRSNKLRKSMWFLMNFSIPGAGASRTAGLLRPNPLRTGRALLTHPAPEQTDVATSVSVNVKAPKLF